MPVNPKFVPSPGKVAVVREFLDEYVLNEETEDGRKIQLVKPTDTADMERRINPWALVVGVGAPRVTDYGTSITTDLQPGDKVIVGTVGRNVELNGEVIYVLPFEGVFGKLEFACDGCGSKESKPFDCVRCNLIPTDFEVSKFTK